MRNTFRKFYSKVDFNNFRSYIMNEYGIEILISVFGNYLIYEKDFVIHEIKFDYDGNNYTNSEVYYIIRLCELLLEHSKIECDDRYYKSPKYVVDKLIKVRTLFGINISAKYVPVTYEYSRWHKSYTNKEIKSHIKVLNSIRNYPA